MSAFVESTSPQEQGPRRALMWGAGLLALGLAAVGVGQPDEGAALALSGLLVTIYGIHRFGRLGPDDPRELAGPVDAAAAPVDAMWLGGLALTVGLALVLGSYFEAGSTSGGRRSVLAWGAIVGGAARLWTGYLALQKVRRVEAKVEKRRRLDKSRAP